MRKQPKLRRWLFSLTACLLAVAMLGAAPDPSARFGKLGHQMMCVCSCGQILLECNHVGCPDSERMIGELREQVSAHPPGAGGTPGLDSQILNWFVAKYGATVLAAPIRGGFDDVAWIIPIAVFLLATIGTAYVVRSWYRKRAGLQPAAATAAPIDDASSDALKARIRRETEY
ncbi:C cytochromes biosynthesis protein [Granulicella sp. WH15]|uniref:cytochrome c-type biogenesis protein n=1 Tax=Granulicella sp. WH15 TaxID=2602070 RepID=UPI001366C632|nr:cytochrome c-type biogenesis protein CcmH [Granulicella sp. WH15]QHN03464.1 C cytochromes biosynthesis protein [Granulicella sp. WH15]